MNFSKIHIKHRVDSMERIKGAIDSRIAEEQARAKAASSSSRSSSDIRRSSAARTESPSKKPRPKTKIQDDGTRGPDPSEFENAFIIGDESEDVSRVGTPAPPDGNTKEALMAENGVSAEATSDSNELGKKKASEEVPKPVASTELPTEVRAKLRKLEKLETRYQGMSESHPL